MHESMSDAELEGLLRPALRSRPESVSRGDIAAMALARVRVREAGWRRVAQVRWWGSALGVAAGLLIIAMLGAGWWMMPASAGMSSSGTTATASVSSSSSESDGGTALAWAGLAVLAIAVVGVAGVGAMGERGVRLGMG